METSRIVGEISGMHDVRNIVPQQQNINNCISKNEMYIKRTANAYIVWSRAERRKIVLEHPNMSNSEIFRKLGATWRRLSENEKRPFIEEAKRIREQHIKDNPGCKFRPRRKRKAVTKRTDSLIMNQSFSPAWGSPNPIDSNISMQNSQIDAYGTVGKTNFDISSISTYEMPFIPYPPTIYRDKSYGIESQQFQLPSVLVSNDVQSYVLNAPENYFLCSYENICYQDMNAVNSIDSSLINSPLLSYDNLESEQNESSITHLSAQTEPFQVSNTSADYFSTFESEHPSTSTMSISRTTDSGYSSSSPCDSQIASSPASESIFPDISGNNVDVSFQTAISNLFDSIRPSEYTQPYS